MKAGLVSFPNPLASLKLLLEQDLSLLLLCNGIFYAANSHAQVSLSLPFIQVDGHKELQAGLIYTPVCLGGSTSAYVWDEYCMDPLHICSCGWDLQRRGRLRGIGASDILESGAVQACTIHTWYRAS